MKLLSKSLILALLVLLIPVSAKAQQQVNINSQVDFIFSESLEFTAAIQSTSDIARVVVYLRNNSETEVVILPAELSSGQDTYSAERDLNIHPIEPFSRNTYWWHVDFIDGSSFESQAYSFQYYDNRSTWYFESDQRSETTIHVFWNTNTSSLGQTALNTAFKALPTLEAQTARTSPESLSIFLYQHPDEIPSITGTDAGHHVYGKALPESNTILLAVEDTDEAAAQLDRLLPHELTHLMLHNRLGAAYNNLPNWLSEGFAVLHEQNPDPELHLALQDAVADDDLISIESLCGTFPSQAKPAELAYAESASFVQYILDVYGTGAFSALLDAYQEGTSCEGGVNRVFQRDLSTLESEWLTSLNSSQNLGFSNLLPWFLLALPVLLLLGFTMFLKYRPASE